MHLPDINVWLALAFEVHVHHKAAAHWLDTVHLPAGAAFCRLTQQGFLRLATNPTVFGQNALTLDDAWSAYDALLADERIAFLPEPIDMESGWREYTTGHRYSHRAWSDAYLAAFARSGHLNLVSFDSGFRSYEGLAFTMLREEPDPVSGGTAP
jgi:toxin-antitoxin system PIN domain toxin